MTYVFSFNYARIKIDLYGSLSLEKTWTLHNVIINIKSVLNKDHIHCRYNIFFEKCSYQLPKKIIINKFLSKL